MTPRPSCGSATSAASATCSRAGSTPCRARRRSRRSASAIAATASSSQTVDRYIGEFERLLERGLAGRARPGDRAQLSHLRHRQGLHHAGARGRTVRIAAASDATRELARGAARALVVSARFWHRGAMASTLTVRTERWPIAGAFTIARGAKTEAEVVVVELADGAASSGAANACPMRAMARPLRASWRRSRRCAARWRRARPAGAATRDAGGRRAQRARLRVLGS